MKDFAVKSNAKENSRQTCDGGGVKVSCCRENAMSLDDGGDVKVSCSGKQCHIS